MHINTKSKSHTTRDSLNRHSTHPPVICMLAIDDVAGKDGSLRGSTIQVLVGFGRNDHRTYRERIYISQNDVANRCKQRLVQYFQRNIHLDRSLTFLDSVLMLLPYQRWPRSRAGSKSMTVEYQRRTAIIVCF